MSLKKLSSFYYQELFPSSCVSAMLRSTSHASGLSRCSLVLANRSVRDLENSAGQTFD